MSSSRATVVAGLAVGVVAVSASAILTRYALEGADALAIAWWRTLGGALALAPFALRNRLRSHARLPAARRRQLAASGAFLALHFALFIGSLALTTVASAVTLATMSPLFVALGASRFLGESTSRRTWQGMAVTIVGALVVGLADGVAIDLGPQALLGDAMAFASALAVSGYLLLGRTARRDVPPTVYSASVYAWAALALGIVSVAGRIELTGYDARTWLAIGAIVLGPQLLGHTVFNTLLSRVRPTIVSIVVLTEPVAATLLAWLLLAELPAPLFFAGAPLVLVGVFRATARGRARVAASPDAPEPIDDAGAQPDAVTERH